MKTILVPTDFSKCSVYGLELAADLAKRTKAKIFIVNVIKPVNYYYPANAMVESPANTVILSEAAEQMKEESFENLNILLKKNFLSGLHCQILTLTDNNIHNAIVDYSKKINAGVIVMGSHGSSGFKGIFLGNTAERVVRFSECPVIVVPEKIKKLEFKNLVFASDFKEEAYEIFPLVKNFARFYGLKIKLLKVNVIEHFKRTADNILDMRAFNKHFKNNYPMTVYDDYTIDEGILNFAEDSNADIIAIGTHGKKGLARFLKSDISEDTIRLTNKPILVVNFKADKHKSDLICEENQEEIIL